MIYFIKLSTNLMEELMLITICEIGIKSSDRKVFFDVDDEECYTNQELKDLEPLAFIRYFQINYF